MEYIVFAAVILLALSAKGCYDKLNYKKKVRQQLRNQFGTVSDETYSEEKLSSLKSYFEAVRRPAYDIDDITWNDLELEELFMVLNRTVSAVGEEYLYSMLRKPEFDTGELTERERLISFFLNNEESRIAVQEALYQIGKNKYHSVYACMDYMKNVKRASNLPHYLSIAALAAAIVLAFFMPAIGVVAACGVLVFNLVTYMKRRSEMEAYLNTATYIIRLLYASEALAKSDIPEISVYTGRLKMLNRHFASFKRNFWIVGSRKPTGDFMDLFMTYLRMLLHLDLIKFNSMLKIYDRHSEELKQLYETAGYLDALCAAASFRAFLGTGEYCVPELVEGSIPVYEAEEMYHPLLEKPVKNTIFAKRSVLLTGSNASGKSTFLKAAAVNALLSQTVHTAAAKSYRASYFQILSSMALRDNMQGSESYFIVEIKSLKRIYEAAQAPVCTLCFVDEVLRGTNTVERIAASREVLAGLAGGRTICFSATHDIELTYLLEQVCDNYHFEETVTDDCVKFDYVLRKGRAVSRNAIKLLRMLGYPEEVTEHAESSAEHFLTTGEWQ
ncbi:MAG: hypothetical protein J1E35_00700 [Lachnospiraceae bacterium]|nr:hypothetical protein [Lachnospiraceae bacterium]